MAEQHADRRAKWRKWDEHIHTQIVWLYRSRRIFARLREIVDKNPTIKRPNTFYNWIARNYACEMCVTIRRLLDKDRCTMSLFRLVQDVADHRELITRGEFVAPYVQRDQCPEVGRRHLDEAFDEFAGTGKNEVDPAVLRDRAESAYQSAIPIKGLVDKVMAHSDRDRLWATIWHDDLDGPIEAIGELYRFIHLLLTRNCLASLEPVEVEDWTRIFTEPWILPESEQKEQGEVPCQCP